MTHRKQPRARRQKRANAPLLKGASAQPFARKIAYCRVSRDDQDLAVQLRIMRDIGVDDMFVEKISAVNAKRPMWHLMLKFLESGDTLFFYAFNRLCRDVKQLLGFIDDMKALGVTLRSTTEPHIDPFTVNGRLMATIVGGVDEHERGRLSERTRDGVREKMKQGMHIGRRAMFDRKQADQIRRDRKRMTAAETAAKWKCSIGTIDKYAPMRGKK